MGKPITTAPVPWESVLLLCGKCARKMDGGYGPDKAQTLRQALRGVLADTGRRRRVRIVESRCLGLCPRKAVTALNPAHPEAGMLTVPRGSDPAEALAKLLPASQDRPQDMGGVSAR